ncbi:MAG: DUF4302 domain-containing protein [Tannerella sp.]|jgi:hypothetical protein|nr:DUF4302 domain-containing protein [Tannerella sp.]
MKRIYHILLLTSFALTSCIQDEKDIFDISASERIVKAMNEYRELLTSAENGWLMEYYPEDNQKIGGYTMIAKFTADGNVALSCETETFVPARQVEVSEWDIFVEQSVVLSFSTYNRVIHYFCNPSTADVDGMDSDYEFIFFEGDHDRIVMKGKKHGNKVTMRRNTSDFDANEYYSQVAQMADVVSEYGQFLLYIKGDSIGNALITDRTLNLRYPVAITDNTFETKTKVLSYTFTPTGIRLYEPFTMNGTTMENFVWNASAERYDCTDSGADAYLKAFYPDNFQLRYSQFLGRWKMEYFGAGVYTPTAPRSSVEVELTLRRKNASFLMINEEFFSFAGIEFLYNSTDGTLSFVNYNGGVNYIDNRNNVYVMTAAVSEGSSGYAYYTNLNPYGFNGEWNRDREKPVITLKTNGRYPTANAIILRLFAPDGTNVGTFSGNAGGSRFVNIVLTKID